MSAIRILEPSGSDGAIQLQKNGELGHSDDLFFDVDNSRLGIGTNVPEETLHVAGDVKIDGKLTAVEYHTKIVSSSIIHQSGSTTFGDTEDDVHNFTGQAIFNTGLSGSLTTLADGSPFMNGDNGILITSGSDGSVTIESEYIIGPAEDGNYDDGLFEDFTSETLMGTAVDRFNEILKALSPPPAPNISNIDCNQTGKRCRLSYDSSNILSSYTPVGTSTGFSEISVNDIFQNNASAGENIRKGVFNSSSTIRGDVNEQVANDTHATGKINYSNNAFGNANQGTLNLNLNGVIIHSIDLEDASLGAGSPGNGSAESLNTESSGFTHISALASAKFADGTLLDLFQHRTARYAIDPASQRNGWNILKVIHDIGGNETTTNSVEWLVDENEDAITLSDSSFSALSMTGISVISGVSYNTGGTAQYTVSVQNAYSNVYTANNNITFSSSNCTSNQVPMPQIDLVAGEDETKEITITTLSTINQNILLNESFSTSINIDHPTKSNIVSGAEETVTGLLVYNISDSSTDIIENFSGETYRLEAGEYIVQDHVVNVSNAWDSYESLNDKDGMLVYNQKLVAPRSAINNGNFSSILNGPTSNVDYSGITAGTRTYYRKIKNTSGGSQSDLLISINGSGTIVQHGSSYGASGLSISVKIPTTTSGQTTGWLDLSQPFATGQYSTGDGCLQGTLDSSLNCSNTITFGTKFLNNDEYIVLKIECDASFTGHINSVSIDWG